MTLIVATLHAFAPNKSFDSEGLYLAAFFLDLTILEVIFGIFT